MSTLSTGTIDTRRLARALAQFPDDASALSRYARTGDPRAFEALIARYQSMVLGTCARVLRSAADAEDAAQETFLKLAKNAGRIRGNAAAWLHACALGTATDLLRARGSRARAEADAGRIDAAPSEDERTWREIEPHLDAALARLSEDERDAIVGHFLAGRSQKDLAKEAGVSAGTMSRRIERALDALGAGLRASGLALAGAGALGSAIGVGVATQAPSATLAGTLGKVALAEAALSGKAIAAGGVLSGATGAIVAVAATGLVVGAGYLAFAMSPLSSGGSSALPAMVLAAGGTGAMPRPTKETSNYEMTDMRRDGDPAQHFQITFDATHARFEVQEQPGGPMLHIVFKIDSDDGKELVCTIESTDMPGPDSFAKHLGERAHFAYTIKDDRLSIQMYLDRNKDNKEIWRGRRLSRPETAPKDKPLWGTWERVGMWRLHLGPQALELRDFGTGATMQKYTILNWSEADAYSKVETICAASQIEPALIGKRVKLLIRKDDGGFSVAFHESSSPKLNEYPSGFEPKKGEGVVVVTVREAAP